VVSLIVAEFRAGKSTSEAHISGMATIVQCNCGAEYRRTEEKFLYRVRVTRSARPAELLWNRGGKAYRREEQSREGS
jgi:hypothetical protein